MFRRPRRDFGQKSSAGTPSFPGAPVEQIRVRTPQPGEVLGIVTELHGGSRMKAQCQDGKERMVRIPGKIRKKLWIKVGDYLLVKPWSVESDAKGDIEYRYTFNQVDILRRKGFIK